LRVKVRVPELLLPSLGAANDRTRVLNNGKPLQSRNPAIIMMGSASEPSLATKSSSSLPRLRLPPGTLNIVSQVAIQYDVDPLKDSRPAPVRYELPPEASPRQLVRKPGDPPLEKLPLPSGSLGELTTSLSPLHRPSPQLKRSMHLMEGLFTLRHMNNKEPKDTGRGSPTISPRSEEPLQEEPQVPKRPKTGDGKNTEDDDPMLLAALKDLEDTSESLEAKIQGIKEAKLMVKRCKGTRHPTSIMSDRTMMVMVRKALLLKQVEEQMAIFKAAQANCEQTLREMVDRGRPPPEELQGTLRFIQKFVHRGAHGKTGNFESFVASFKLPAKHQLLETFRAEATAAGAWWAEKSYEEAQAGAGCWEIKHLMDLAVQVGADDDDPMLWRARDVLMSRLVERITTLTKDCLQKDELAEQRGKERGTVPALGMASTNADRIEKEIFEATRLGMDKTQDCIVEAEAAVKLLRQKDGERKRLHNRNKRMQEAQ